MKNSNTKKQWKLTNIIDHTQAKCELTTHDGSIEGSCTSMGSDITMQLSAHGCSTPEAGAEFMSRAAKDVFKYACADNKDVVNVFAKALKRIGRCARATLTFPDEPEVFRKKCDRLLELTAEKTRLMQLAAEKKP